MRLCMIRHLLILLSSWKGIQCNELKSATDDARGSAARITLAARFCSFSTLLNGSLSQAVHITLA